MAQRRGARFQRARHEHVENVLHVGPSGEHLRQALRNRQAGQVVKVLTDAILLPCFANSYYE